MKTVIVDAVGDQCPLPVVKATRALRELTEPAVLEIRVDNEVAVQNLTRMAAGNHLPVRSEKRGSTSLWSRWRRRSRWGTPRRRSRS